jgi:hypothetical protein
MHGRGRFSCRLAIRSKRFRMPPVCADLRTREKMLISRPWLKRWRGSGVCRAPSGRERYGRS